MTVPADAVPSGTHPPKPRLALSVGVIGHRPKDLAKEDLAKDDPSKTRQSHGTRRKKIEHDVETALAAIATAARQARRDHSDCFDSAGDTTPLLALVSGLAEGADTIAATAALNLGYVLEAALPYARDEYIADFEGDPDMDPDVTSAEQKIKAAVERFDDLCEQARAVLELPGQRRSATDSRQDGDSKENRAYEAVGLTVLSQADIVLAVWDGELSRGRGGTAEMVAEAARVGIPIVLVDGNGEKSIEVRWRSLMDVPAPIVAIDDLPAKQLTQCINRVIDELVRLPAAKEQRQGFERWISESHRCVNFRLGFPILTTFMLARRMRGSDFVPRRPSQLAMDYVRDAAPVVHPADAKKVAWLAEPYGWADAVGTYFAQFFRSAFVMNFYFAAFAVVAASASVMIPIPSAHDATRGLAWLYPYGPAAIELILIISVVVNTIVGRRHHWHRRWVEAREIAERLRVALPLWTLGLRPSFFPGEETTWTGWYARAMVRMQGTRSGKLTSGILAAERAVLLKLLADQCKYNEGNAGRMGRLERALEIVGICLLFATGAVAFGHLFYGQFMERMLDHVGSATDVTIWLSAALPALATATYGIRVIGDFEGISHRAERTHRNLEQLIEAIEQDPADLTLLRARASSAADAMLGDVASWRLAAESRGLAIPG